MAIQVYPDYLGPETRASVDAQPDGTFRLDRLVAGRYRMEGKQKRTDCDCSPASFLHFFEVTSGDIRDMDIHVGYGLKLRGTVQALGGRLPFGAGMASNPRSEHYRSVFYSPGRDARNLLVGFRSQPLAAAFA